MIRDLQQRLLAAGYNPGAIDGINGPRTMTALCLYMSRGQNRANCEGIGASLAQHGGSYAIFTPLRLTHFMGQLAHEAGLFRYMEEIASGAAYEGRRDLGNTSKGDGRRYKGRGPIQLTGRANYRAVGARLGLPLESEPTLAARPDIGLRIALDYWQSRKINAAADADDIMRVTRLINGGTNGLADRIAQTNRARKIML